MNMGDVFEMDCPKCGATIEFWKGDATAKCPECGAKVENPRAETES